MSRVGKSAQMSAYGSVDHIRFNESGTHFLINHSVVQKSRNSTSLYDSWGSFKWENAFEIGIQEVFPFGQSDFLLADQQGSLSLLDLGSGGTPVVTNLSEFSSPKGRMREIAVSKNGQQVFMVMANNELIQCDLNSNQSGSSTKVIRSSEVKIAEVTAITYLDQYQLLALGNAKGELYLCEVVNNELKVKKFDELAHALTINVLETNDVGDQLVSGGRDGMVQVWNLDKIFSTGYRPTGFEVKSAVRDVVFLNNQTLMVASSVDGLKGLNQGEVSLLFLDFDTMGSELEGSVN